MFCGPQSATKDGGAIVNWRMDAPLNDKEQKIYLFSMHRTYGLN